MKVISLNITLGSYSHVQDWILAAAHRRESRTVCFANVHMVIEAKHKPKVADAVNSSDWILPDGLPLTWAMRLLYLIRQDRITGMDMLPSLLERAAKEDLAIFLYGSTSDVLKRSVEKCKFLFPGVNIVGTYSPPFRELTVEEENSVISTISHSGAQLVFVALGCPKQELWINNMRGRIPAVLLAIGGALPVLAGDVTRAPSWMQKMGLEWFFRLMQEPKRLFKRYAVTNSLYVWYMGQQLIIRLLSLAKFS
ncbi:WecB/TagA/CpsF family glycosyltransferase [Spirosoma foliorum]|nr:WecB/TagA/CpsF family glycosyltransferase [Spirosoma foliorum]